MKACCYCRVSVDDVKNPRASIKTQEEVCRKKAEEKGDEIIMIYKDVNRSGGSLKRPQLIQLRKDAIKKLFETIYILNLSRLARKLIDQENFIADMEKIGIQVISTDDSEQQKMMRQMTGIMNEAQRDYYRKQSEIEHTHRLGKIPLNRPPLGYRMKNKKFIIDNKKAEIVKQIFKARKSGKENKEIAEEFKMGIKTIARILQNKTYLGFFIYRKKEIEGNFKPIISEELFNVCQENKNATH